jgi:choline kinase
MHEKPVGGRDLSDATDAPVTMRSIRATTGGDSSVTLNDSNPARSSSQRTFDSGHCVIGLVLAAGAGRRLRPQTVGLPKALIQVDNETTILDIALHNLASVDLRRVAVVIGYAGDAVRERQRDLEQRHGVRLTLIPNDKAEEWNNAYSLWLARDHLGDGALLLNGDTVHPASVEKTLLSARGPEILLALDTEKKLADEEMKVIVDDSGHLQRINKSIEPQSATGEYIGAAIIEGVAAGAVADALKTTYERDPQLYYEDGFQEYADSGGRIKTAAIGTVEWVEVDNHDDLNRAREIACRY